MKINRSTVFQWLKVILPIFLMLFAIREIGKIIREANGEKIASELGAIDVRALVLIAVVPLILAFPMFFYDYFIMKKLKIKRPMKQLMKESLIINSFSNLIGFGGLIGVLLRTHYFKKPEMDNTTFFKMIASVTLFYLAGISLFADILLIFAWDLPLFNEHPFLLLVAGFIGLYTPFLFIKAFIQLLRKKVTVKDVVSDFALIGVSVVEWLGAFCMLVILTKLLHIEIALIDLWPVFVIASAAGIVSMIPGGLGSFDLVFIWGATSLNLPSESVLVLLLCYRVGYYVIPFIAGGALFLRDIWRSFNIGYSSIPNALLEKTTHIIATALVFLAGLALLISSAAPGAIEKLKYIREIMSLPFINVSHQVSVVTGFVLLALSNGISYKDKRSFKVTLFVLIFASILFILKGVQYRQALFMLFVALLLYLSKNRFYRKSYIETWGRSILNTVVISIIILGYIVLGWLAHRNSNYKLPDHIQTLLIRDSGDLFKSAAIGIVVIVCVVVFERWMRKRTQFKKQYANNHLKEINKHLDQYGKKEAFLLGNSEDQCVFWNKKKTVLFPYLVSADKLIVLGDLVGEKEDFKEAIEELIIFADLYGYTPVFYEVSDEFVPYMHGYGFNFFKLGEEGCVDLQTMQFKVHEIEQFDRIAKVVKEQGYEYEVLQAPFTAEFALELDDLLKSIKTTKSSKDTHFFSVQNLNQGPVALIKNEHQEIVAFATLMPLHDERKTISITNLYSLQIDLPSEVLDYLLMKLLMTSKDGGYHQLNVGMMYLQHVGVSKYAGVSEKITAQIIVDAQDTSINKDTLHLKETYANEWKAKYIAYRKRAFLPFTIIQIMMLIGENKFSNKRNQFIAMSNLKKRVVK
ncbi:phosphatidylglycerol lysyltransferase [Kurthia zopfii]|uniref:Phosphatidylglycerol lysyltransferase n=1 Tax=Kurthia zopfii TaxID=1650 RepID=A0A8B4Q5H1_9BACL|nr:bifunctional lysylphosphatidylglycerol flippase/synthetase MprF [Kurthia zopfii]PWI21805.1 bifunctional lysylphosphatidylglycerol flippase/synthetase MprF [Kurthia zopfii]TDR33386.1 phosphatidylglycerol lysyltransferase [Kurthia zopfii]GEK32046.1 phosphatidylglycerol lysyltransferase [Kurthia zopfii]STX08509.1 Phosphatidylglycerol lysyltransferase [Kurthia zopfii]